MSFINYTSSGTFLKVHNVVNLWKTFTVENYNLNAEESFNSVKLTSKIYSRC